jgi:hypothetical protein
MARADFYERTRRYSFLIMLALVVYLGYQVNTGVVALYLDDYRGVFNSAWVGSMLTLVGTFFIGWFGFYMVKGSIARDYDTGVGQIIATTPLRRPHYLLGKWLSNLAVLVVMLGILAGAGVILQLIQREDPTIDLWALWSPFLVIGLPAMAWVAALAAVFDTISWLRGGFGNVVYFFFFAFTIVLAMEWAPIPPALEPLGFKLFYAEMGAAARQAFPDYAGGFSLGASERTVTDTFIWPGVAWTVDIVLWRLAVVGVALVGVLFAAGLFDRFDAAKVVKRSRATTREQAEEGRLPPADMPPPPAHILLSPVRPGFRFDQVLWAELKLLLKGQRWWWYGVAVILVIVGLANESGPGGASSLLAAWIWPVLIWSSLGVREARFATSQMVFSAARPLTRQLPATWLAGVIVTALAGIGVGVRALAGGDGLGLLMWLAGVIFIPSLALACGVWSGTSKLFEVLYVVIWYIGPLNRVSALDFIGVTGAQPFPWLGAGIIFLLLAFIGRWRQLRA